MMNCRQLFLNPVLRRLHPFTIFLLALFLIITAGVSGQARAETFRVMHVIDGDTIILPNHVHVRYIGINTPEIAHDMKPCEYFGNEAMEFNKNLVLGKDVRLEFDKERHDSYGRSLAYVYLDDGTVVNAALVREGYAYVLHLLPNVKYYDRFCALQREAIRNERGMWPGLFETSSGLYTGNRGSKKFHRLTCPYGKRISPKGLVRFRSMKEAFIKGYSPCKRCLGLGQK